MSEGEEVAAGSTDEKTQQLARSELVSMPARSFWIGIALVPIGAATAGFGAAALSGVDTSFSQPLTTIIGGAGVLTAGILTYINGQRSRVQTEAHQRADAERERERHGQDSRRERDRHAEDSRRTQVSSLRDRYTAIAAQIAHESAAIRQAGAYALASPADDWATFKENGERQVCIDLLQWYLRVPFPGGGNSDKPDLPEREIRRTIVRILTERRRLPASDPKSGQEVSSPHAWGKSPRPNRCPRCRKVVPICVGGERPRGSPVDLNSVPPMATVAVRRLGPHRRELDT
ncbi:hypothetical protein [Nocardia sp. NPDC050717]|uniref:hypothetical protein n=1 Tax=Nocardia sp. NPDC050717 TaxID=3157221 RepID=UPI00340DCDDB